MSWLDFLRRGERKGWPAGWSQGAALYNKYTGKDEPMPITWTKGRKALKRDYDALFSYYGHTNVNYDKHSVVGKRDPKYTTVRQLRMRELGYGFLDRLRY